MLSTVVPIQGTFDIAKGRNSLRTHIAVQHWPATFGAHASALLTALGELILSSGEGYLVPVQMFFEDGDDAAGIRFVCAIPMYNIDSNKFQDIISRLERASDTIDIKEDGVRLHIAVGLWINSRSASAC
jgi:hypothetical protein